MKRISSERAKSAQISARTKKTVYERDNGLCVVCGQPGSPEAHYIPRSAGGLGTEQNVVTMCRHCHDRFDHGDRASMRLMGEIVRAYLIGQYPWEDYPKDRNHPGDCDLVYKKYGGEL